jgi:hypothetical protein
MAGYYKRQDLTQQVRVMQEQIRRLQSRVPPGSSLVDTHSFIVGGSVDPSLYIPPAHIFLPDPADEALAGQVTSVYWNYGFYCRTGSVNINLKLIRGGSESTVTDTTVLQNNDKLRAQIISGSGEDLTAWYVLIHEVS